MNNSLKIINALAKEPDSSFTMYGLSQKTKIPYASLYRTIKTLNDLIIKTKAGQAVMVRINSKNPLIKHYLIISSAEEQQEFLAKQPMLKVISQEIPQGNYSVLLFGSYARGTQTPKSDIDLLIINEDGDRTPDFSKYETIFNKKINPIYVTTGELKRMLKDALENVGKQALRNHITLYNPELFWNLAYDAQQSALQERI